MVSRIARLCCSFRQLNLEVGKSGVPLPITGCGRHSTSIIEILQIRSEHLFGVPSGGRQFLPKSRELLATGREFGCKFAGSSSRFGDAMHVASDSYKEMLCPYQTENNYRRVDSYVSCYEVSSKVVDHIDSRSVDS
jgi:hypothetical protein